MNLIRLSATISPEALIQAGEEVGLSKQAINYFRHAEEYPLELQVDDNGLVRSAKILTKFK